MLYSMLANETAGSISSQERRVCLGVIVTESIVIFIINAYTPIVFARNRHLRKNSTYLIINLTVADLLVGAVSEPLELYWSEPIDFWPGFSTSWKDFSILIFFSLFPISSLTNLSFISLERLHATLYPIMHFVIGKWVYFKAVICSWLLALLLSSVMAVFYHYVPGASRKLWVSCIALTLLILTISYVVIIANIKSNRPPRHSGPVISDRKLSITLFIVTFVSMLTILPWAIYAVIPIGIWNRLSKTTQLHMTYVFIVVYYVSSLVNPLIYALRLEEFKKAVKELICKTAPASSHVQPIELHAM